MPFTPAHPAIILPFINKKYFSATGLIIGSVSPDFEYFLKARVEGIHGHTLAGLFYFDLPIVFFWALIFHMVIKQSLISNLPLFLQRRLKALRELNFKTYLTSRYLVFGLSALLGASSHIFWDSFTHNGKFFVELLPIYKGAYVPFQAVKYPLWYALQHISTFTGLTIVFIYIILLPVNLEVVTSEPKISYWIALTLLAGLFFAIRFSIWPNELNLGNAVVTSISSLLLAVCLISLIPSWKITQISN